MEIWVQSGESKHLEVSSLGRVRSVDRLVNNWPSGVRTITGRVLSSKWLRNGYPSVVINGRSEYAHRLIALVFCRNENSLPCVNHIDGNKENNQPKNLEWVTHKDNMRHASKSGLLLFSRSIIRSADRFGACAWYPMIASVSIDGFSRTAVNNCLSGRSNTSGGYEWKYCE